MEINFLKLAHCIASQQHQRAALILPEGYLSHAKPQNAGAPSLLALISPTFLLRLDFYVARLTS